MPIYTGVCACGCRDFVDNFGEYECTECGEMYTISSDEDNMDDVFGDIDNILNDEEGF